MHNSSRARFVRNKTKSETRQQYRPMGMNRMKIAANLNLKGHQFFLLTLYAIDGYLENTDNMLSLNPNCNSNPNPDYYFT